MAVTRTDPPRLKRQYPHVDDITDWRAKQSIRLLWDRIFDLEARLQAGEASLDTLVDHANDQDDQIRIARLDAKEALAIAQRTAAQVAADAPLPEGESTIPDYESIANAVYATFNPVVAYADREAGKAQLTRAIAWEIYNTTDTNMGLLEKTSGTQINGRSTDIVVQMTDGSYADVASETNDGVTATIHVSWIRKAPDTNTTDESRWIVPTSAIAAESGPMAPA